MMKKETGVNEMIFMIYGKLDVVTSLQSKGKVGDFVIDSIEEMGSYGEYEYSSNENQNIRLKANKAGAYYAINFVELRKSVHKIV